MLLAAQVGRGLDNGDFERRTHGSFQEVSASHRAVTQPEDGMKMQTCFAVIPLRNVADQTQDLALLTDRNRLVALCFDIEPANPGMFEGADRSDRGAADFFLIREFRYASEGLFRRIQDQDNVRSRPSTTTFDFIRFLRGKAEAGNFNASGKCGDGL
jgi:hypothetical protein